MQQRPSLPMATPPTTRSDWLAAHPPRAEQLTQTLAVPGFRAISIAQAPAAFRRRGIFVPERSLHRV